MLLYVVCVPRRSVGVWSNILPAKWNRGQPKRLAMEMTMRDGWWWQEEKENEKQKQPETTAIKWRVGLDSTWHGTELEVGWQETWEARLEGDAGNGVLRFSSVIFISTVLFHFPFGGHTVSHAMQRSSSQKCFHSFTHRCYQRHFSLNICIQNNFFSSFFSIFFSFSFDISLYHTQQLSLIHYESQCVCVCCWFHFFK